MELQPVLKKKRMKLRPVLKDRTLACFEGEGLQPLRCRAEENRL
jgi:hypothetical protein